MFNITEIVLSIRVYNIHTLLISSPITHVYLLSRKPILYLPKEQLT